MNVSVENLGACKRLLRIEVPVERVNAVFDEVTGQFQKAAQLPGFRPGKAPRHLILRSFEGRIVEEARRKLIEDSYREAARQQNLRVVVTQNVEEQQFGRDLPLQFTVNLEAAPDFELPNYKGLAARRELAVATDGDVDRALNILREQQAKYNDVAREAATGDVVVVHYQGTCEGRPITEISPAAQGLGAKQNTWLLIAENSFVPGFTPQLVGAKAGDQRQVTVTFPADFVVQEVAGKTASYAVEVLGVKEKLLPEVNEDFARLFGLASVEDLLRGIRNDLQRELDTRQKRSVRDQLLKALLAQREFDLPESVVASETRNLVFNIVNENQQRGVPREAIEEKKEDIFKSASLSARDRVKAAFILNRIAEAEKISVDQQELTQRVVALARQNNMAPEKMAKSLQERNAFPEIQQDILTGKVLDFIELQAQVEEVPVLPQTA